MKCYFIIFIVEFNFIIDILFQNAPFQKIVYAIFLNDTFIS